MMRSRHSLTSILTLFSTGLLTTLPAAATNYSNPYYLLLGTGISYSQSADIYADPTYWDASPQGYNSSVDHSVLYTAGVGAQITPALSVVIDGSMRPGFSYERYQTSNANNTPGFLGDKTRYFELENTSLMVDAYLQGKGLSDHLYYNLGHNMGVQPIASVGVGVAYNTVTNFHSVTGNTASSIMPDKTTSSFAWKASVGLQLTLCPKVDIAASYQYFDGGDFQSNNYIVDSSRLVVTPWKGKLKANEGTLNLVYHI